ncbi:MAG: PLP-dependent aminotransferase family protein [Clostridia bacterium]|nr:PLP-dependent aminotransferase family protein [Clostridia bacterium]
MKEKAYLKLYHRLRREIETGVYAYGVRLPSKRGMAEDAGVSVITVEHAYGILADEGYIEPRERSGYFVSYRERDFLSAAEPTEARGFSGHTAHMAGGEFPFSVLAKTMRRVLQEYGERILVKSPNHGCPELRRAIAAYLARMGGMQVRAEQIIIGSGAEYLYSLIAQLLGERTFALESPGYDKIRRVYEACGVITEQLKMGPEGIKSRELARSAAGVLHITPFHSFPSNVTASVSKRREYIAWATARDGYIVEDNYDSELTVSTKSEDTVFSMAHGRVIYLNTFSGTVAPSIRVGYMVLPEGLLEKFEQKLGFYSCTVPVFEQYVLAELIGGGDFERHIHRIRRKRRKNQ